MHTTASFDYFEAPSFQIVALPYRGDNLSMIVFLPKQNVELARFEELLTQANLTEWLANLRPDPRMIDLTIPRFKVTLQVDLEDALRRMGVNAAFSNKADFTGITASGFINISAIRYKAYISVDEEGTEAAAVTAVGMTYNSQISPQPVPIVFRADHPFAFLIQDRRSGVILFLGRLSNPQE